MSKPTPPIKPEKMKAVLLDVSGVLRDNLQAIWQSYRRVLEPAGWTLDATAAEAYRLRGFSRYNLLENCLEALYALQQEKVPLKKALQNPSLIDEAVAGHPLSDKAEWGKKIKADFRRTDAAYLESIPVLAGSREALYRLSQRFKIAAVSNSGSVFNQAWLTHHELDRFITVFVGEQDVARKKPHPEGVVLAAEKLFAKTPECYLVGDAQSDMLAALQAGAVSIGVLTGTATQRQLFDAGANEVFESLWAFSKSLQTPKTGMEP